MGWPSRPMSPSCTSRSAGWTSAASRKKRVATSAPTAVSAPLMWPRMGRCGTTACSARWPQRPRRPGRHQSRYGGAGVVRRLRRHLGRRALWGGHWYCPDARSGAQLGLWRARFSYFVSDAWRVPRQTRGHNTRDWGAECVSRSRRQGLREGVSEVLISSEMSHTNFYGRSMISFARAGVSVLLVHGHQVQEVMIYQHL